MRIGIVVEYLTERGGTQRQALELARALARRGEEPVVIARVHKPAACYPELSRGIQIAAQSKLVDAQSLQKPRRLQWLRRTFGPAARAIGMGYLAQLATMRRSSAEFLAFARAAARGCAVLNPHDYGPAAWVAAKVAREMRLPCVWQCNDPLLRWAKPRGPGRLMRRIVVGLDYRYVRSIKNVTVLDSRVAHEVQRRYRIAPEIVRSGVDVARFAELPSRSRARSRLGLPLNAPALLLLTSLNSPHRRIEDCIAAHARCGHDAWLLLCAPLCRPFSRYALRVLKAVRASPARERIVWRDQPFADDEELRQILAASDIFVFPNVKQTWGLAAVEAAAAGLAVVVSDGAGVSEIFTAGETAIIYPGTDVEALTTKLRQLLDDAPARKRLARAGQAFVQTHFGWDRYAESMSAIFARALAEGRPV